MMGGGGVRFSLKFEATVIEARLAGFRMEAFSPPQSEPLVIVDGIRPKTR